MLDAAPVAYLHRAHLLTVPFENLSIHLGEEISLADDDVFSKIVARGRLLINPATCLMIGETR